MKFPHDHPHAEHSCCATAPTANEIPQGAAAERRGTVFRIAAMDCAAEESEIQRALEPVSGIRGLGFQLGARTLAIDAPGEAMGGSLLVVTNGLRLLHGATNKE